MDPALAPGQIVAGKYRVDAPLGAGGMGVVVRATHLELGHQVALKCLRPEVAPLPYLLARFQREARTLARLRSEHVARVFDVGTLPSGLPFIVMELLEGVDLGRRLRALRRLPAAEAVEAVLQACDALAEAHALGIVHRDLKPSNLFRAERSGARAAIKVLDFGISRLLEAEPGAMRLTSPEAALGSPRYIAPEQACDPRDADPRSDVWSLGIILFELCAGAAPFDDLRTERMLARVLTEPAPDLGRRGVPVPPGLPAVVARCLAKDPADRFADAAALAAALAPCAPAPGAAP
ncbi:MAG TPA: serine/threonine-protein kinase [Polyangia bacterium]|jgi:serine/threonine-protein kinase